MGLSKDISTDVQDALAAREQMLAIVSHDIKNPLSAIQLEVQMLLRVAERHGASKFSDDVKIQAHRILKTTDRLKDLISELLDRNKSADGLACLNKETVDAVKLFQDVLDSHRPLIHHKSLIVKTDFPTECQALLDKNKLFQVLANLLGNAIKFTPNNGQLELGIQELHHEIIMMVIDNGEGLSPRDLSKVFEKYWTSGISGHSGTGLGLFICKTIVEAHGGHIRVSSMPSGGTKFWFSIPKPEKFLKDQEKKILIIDDDEDLREVISWALNKEGFAVQTYPNALVALEALRLGLHEPLLIVLDFHMDDMLGSEFLKLKQEFENSSVKDCPVMMISASPEDWRDKVSPGLCLGVMTKPLDLQGLIDKIKDIIL